MGRRRKQPEQPPGHVGLQCRLSDWQCLAADEFEHVSPSTSGEIAYFRVPWPSHWFDPESILLRFPYVGSFESRDSQLWFACDGKEVGAFEAWLPSFEEMKKTPPKIVSGEIDTSRQSAFERYRAIRARAEAIIHDKKS